MRVCVVLPTKNEEENIEYMIKEIKKYCKYPIFIVDEQSTDNTIKIAKKLKVKCFQRKKEGYGEGVKEGLKIAKERGFSHIVLLDCDGSYPPRYIPMLVKYAKQGYDIVTTARNMKDIIFLHRIANIFHTKLTNLLYLTRLKDINTGMKILKIDKFIGKLKASGMDLTAEILLLAIKRRYKIKQIPIEYKDRRRYKDRGKSKIKIKDGFTIMFRIIKERFSD